MGISIRKLVVDGFGIFHDFTLELDPGLTVLWGPNEAGKTTLMAFIRAMFFGFPDGRSRENRYEPLRGGRHGGQLFLQAEGGQEYILTLTGSGRGQRVLRRQRPADPGTRGGFAECIRMSLPLAGGWSGWNPQRCRGQSHLQCRRADHYSCSN